MDLLRQGVLLSVALNIETATVEIQFLNRSCYFLPLSQAGQYLKDLESKPEKAKAKDPRPSCVAGRPPSPEGQDPRPVGMEFFPQPRTIDTIGNVTTYHF